MAGVVFCNRCGHRNPAGANFCSSCGAALERTGDHTATLPVTDASHATGEHDVVPDLSDLAVGTGVLIVRSGPDAGLQVVLTDAVTHLGRHPKSEIFLDDITVSRRHAEIEHKSGTFVVRDVGSLNGTYLNRTRIEEANLQPGDEVQVGKFKLLFLIAAGQ
ncbi:MAG: FHA domain-containing protein [Acidimicrobiia bacterium]